MCPCVYHQDAVKFKRKHPNLCSQIQCFELKGTGMEHDKRMAFSRLVSFTVPYRRHGLNKLFGLKLLALNPTRGMFLSMDACFLFFLNLLYVFSMFLRIKFA